jgi:hypothetical protein
LGKVGPIKINDQEKGGSTKWLRKKERRRNNLQPLLWEGLLNFKK